MIRLSFIASILLIVLMPVRANGFASADCSATGVEYSESRGGTLIASIPGPSGWSNVWGVAYHDYYNMLYVGGCPNNEVAYGTYSGGEIVSWTVFDTVEAVCGFGCYQDNLLFALTQSDPLNPGPFYLYSWNLDASGIPILPADVFELGAPFTGAMGGCEWDGEYLWIVDQNFVVDDNAIIYKYDVNAHSVVSSWSYSELGAVGIACVWDAGDLRIWISDWYGGRKLMEHTESGVMTGLNYEITTSPTDIAYKYDVNFDGPGFFVGNHSGNTLDFYDHTLTSLEHNSWGQIKASFL
ncbi:MAG: hypothetical protein K8S24_06010 [Candidatus Aegiribacteria sp.]|nr:hypothetical protein [Candidatus Aegiribacteria sp.]